jgi:hypothetical protein
MYRRGRISEMYNLQVTAGNVLNLPEGGWAERMRLRTIYAVTRYIKAQGWNRKYLFYLVIFTMYLSIHLPKLGLAFTLTLCKCYYR